MKDSKQDYSLYRISRRKLLPISGNKMVLQLSGDNKASNSRHVVRGPIASSLWDIKNAPVFLVCWRKEDFILSSSECRKVKWQ